MSAFFSWESPSSRLVLSGVLGLLAEHGYEGLTVAEVRARAGAAGPGLGDSPDLEALVIAALEEVQLFPAPQPTGQLRQDLRKLLNPWRRAPSPDERAVAAVLSVAGWRPRLKVAVYEAFDRPLMHAVAAIVARGAIQEEVPPRLVQTLCWVLRGLMLDRLRSGPRSPIDLDLLVDFLVTGLTSASVADAATENREFAGPQEQGGPF
jgi:Tetracyclin repressor-like, C-terminal domain